MRLNCHFVILILLLPWKTWAQKTDQNSLFADTSALNMYLGFSIGNVKKEKNDTVLLFTDLLYKNNQNQWDSLEIGLAARGNFRRAKCFFPPIKLKVNKKSVKNTIFSGHKTLKLVLPCQNRKNANAFVIKEYVCYKLYEQISDYAFKTRLIQLELTDKTEKSEKKYDVLAFIIEDDKKVAKRHNAKIRKDLKLHPIRYQDTASVKHDFFQYMIGNTDWSLKNQHNVKTIQFRNKDFIPVPYDFDMSGLVNAPYAQVSELLEISSVQQRIYRGFCRNEALFHHVKQEYLALEPQLWETIKTYESRLQASEYNRMEKFMNEFFNTLKNDNQFNNYILKQCRKP